MISLLKDRRHPFEQVESDTVTAAIKAVNKEATAGGFIESYMINSVRNLPNALVFSLLKCYSWSLN